MWTATRDFKQRKFHYTRNYHYGIELQTSRRPLRVFLLILLAGDVAANPSWSSTFQNFLCMSLNARSLTSLHNLRNSSKTLFTLRTVIYIVFVSETWLKNHICSLEILHSGYTIFRNDRATRGGGVLLAVKSSSFKCVRKVEHDYNLEITLAEIITATNMKVLLGTCYRPPNEDHNWMDCFNNLLGNICQNYQHIVLAGDFNFPQISCNSPDTTRGVIGNTFMELLNDYFMVQLNNTATRGNNILDLVVTNTPDLVKINGVLSPSEADIFTDHNIINFDLSISPKHLPKIDRTVYDYRNGNFTALKSSLECLNLSDLISANGDISDEWCTWKDTFLTTLRSYEVEIIFHG